MPHTSVWALFGVAKQSFLASRIALAAGRVAAGRDLSPRQRLVLQEVYDVLTTHRTFAEGANYDDLDEMAETLPIVRSSVNGLAPKTIENEGDQTATLVYGLDELLAKLELVLADQPDHDAAKFIRDRYIEVSEQMSTEAQQTERIIGRPTPQTIA